MDNIPQPLETWNVWRHSSGWFHIIHDDQPPYKGCTLWRKIQAVSMFDALEKWGAERTSEVTQEPNGR